MNEQTERATEYSDLDLGTRQNRSRNRLDELRQSQRWGRHAQISVSVSKVLLFHEPLGCPLVWWTSLWYSSVLRCILFVQLPSEEPSMLKTSQDYWFFDKTIANKGECYPQTAIITSLYTTASTPKSAANDNFLIYVYIFTTEDAYVNSKIVRSATYGKEIHFQSIVAVHGGPSKRNTVTAARNRGIYAGENAVMIRM